MIYKNVVSLLKLKINSLTCNIGDLLPSEKELADQYDVSRNTIRKALKELEDSGLVQRRHGSGTRIKNKHLQASLTSLDSFTEMAENEGKSPSSLLIKFELQGASDEIASGLNLKNGDPVYYSKRLRFINNIPLQLEETWLSVDRFPSLTIAHMKQSKFSYIENDCGVKIVGSYESIMPVLPSREIAQLLRISTKDPILKMHTQAIDKQHCPIDYSILHTNTFEFQVKRFTPRKMVDYSNEIQMAVK